MYCVNGKPHASLFIESTDSMIRMSVSERIIFNIVVRSYQLDLLFHKYGGSIFGLRMYKCKYVGEAYFT